MITEKEKKNLKQFYRAILALEDEEECRKFFDDVATIKEALDLSARLEVARAKRPVRALRPSAASTSA